MTSSHLPASSTTPAARTTVGALRAIGRALLRQPRWLAWALPGMWLAGIWSLSTRTLDLDLPHRWWTAWLGNGLHAFEFGVLAILSLPLLRRRGDWVDWRGPGPRCLALGCIACGLVDEWWQSGVAGRSASLWDLLTDSVGILVSMAMAFLLTDPALPARRLHRAILIGIALCALAAAVATAWDSVWEQGWWPLPRRQN